jgi:prepilin-type processing-associated H-X9-DG protein
MAGQGNRLSERMDGLTVQDQRISLGRSWKRRRGIDAMNDDAASRRAQALEHLSRLVVRILVLFITIAALAIALWATISNWMSIRVGSPITCDRNLRKITAALEQYRKANNRYPPAYIADRQGKPMHSWRVLILPYLDRSDLYELYRLNEPWDGPNNRKLHDKVIKAFCCPTEYGKSGTTNTSYVAVVGKQTIWGGNKVVFKDNVPDSPAHTLLIVQVANSGIHWMEPRDLQMDQMDMSINGKPGRSISSVHKRGANVAFADGRIEYLFDKLPSEVLRALLTWNGGEKITSDGSGNYRLE